MNVSKPENPSAFPVHPEAFSSDQNGMTLRDYFAIHVDQPGAAEIVCAAGLVWSEQRVWHPDDGKSPIGNFDQWWRDLCADERARLYAKVRYQLADAMLAERSTQKADPV